MMTSDMPIGGHKFPLGQVVATPGALAALEAAGSGSTVWLQLHAMGQWGHLGAEDRAVQDASLQPNADLERLMSVWMLSNDTKIWIITEWDRSVTTILLPDEY